MESMSTSSVKNITLLEGRIERITESGCWLWLGTTSKKGYGMLRRGSRANNKYLLAHRHAFELYRGRIPEGLQLDHKCRVRCCVNPDHLEPVTLQENIRRGMSGRYQKSKPHCPRGHEYIGSNIGYGSRGERRCRRCRREAQRASRALK